MAFLFNSLDVPRLLQELRSGQISCLPAISSERCRVMRSEALRHTFKAALPEYGANRIQQRYTYTRAFSPLSCLWTIGEELCAVIRSVADSEDPLAFSSKLRFTEITAHVYKPGPLGISLHRDQKKFFKNLIAVCVIEGEGEFYTATSRVGGIETVIPATPGDIIFMATDGSFNYDRCPLHGVRNIKQERMTITFRQQKFEAA